jgi:hypothetical protein
MHLSTGTRGWETSGTQSRPTTPCPAAVPRFSNLGKKEQPSWIRQFLAESRISFRPRWNKSEDFNSQQSLVPIVLAQKQCFRRSINLTHNWRLTSHISNADESEVDEDDEDKEEQDYLLTLTDWYVSTWDEKMDNLYGSVVVKLVTLEELKNSQEQGTDFLTHASTSGVRGWSGVVVPAPTESWGWCMESLYASPFHLKFLIPQP